MEEKQLHFFQYTPDQEEDGFPRRRLLKIPLDSLLLLGIINIFILVFSFSLGIERGKTIARSEERLTQRTLAATAPVTPQREGEGQRAHGVHRKEQKNGEKKKSIQPPHDDNKYIIQVASYRKKEIAEEERERLKKEGFPAIVTKKGQYIVIYIGEFSTKEKAKETQEQLKPRFNDTIIRRL